MIDASQCAHKNKVYKLYSRNGLGQCWSQLAIFLLAEDIVKLAKNSQMSCSFKCAGHLTALYPFIWLGIFNLIFSATFLPRKLLQICI